MCSQFSEVFQLCEFVLDNSQNPPLVGVTLETLLRFLNWIPLGYIFETKLISTLIFKFLNVPMFRNVTLKVRILQSCKMFYLLHVSLKYNIKWIAIFLNNCSTIVPDRDCCSNGATLWWNVYSTLQSNHDSNGSNASCRHQYSRSLQ